MRKSFSKEIDMANWDVEQVLCQFLIPEPKRKRKTASVLE
jgi:hypothetical protein